MRSKTFIKDQWSSSPRYWTQLTHGPSLPETLSHLLMAFSAHQRESESERGERSGRQREQRKGAHRRDRCREATTSSVKAFFIPASRISGTCAGSYPRTIVDAFNCGDTRGHGSVGVWTAMSIYQAQSGL
jgi:hypothetical protein